MTGRDGGYFYFNRLKTREFSLPCWVEDISIKQWERIKRWLDRETEGRLIFDDAPFLYYNVRPTKAITYKIYPTANGRINGTFTAIFTAYDPCGYLLYDRALDSVKAKDYCDILEAAYLPAAPDLNTNDFLLYNCGTEPCDTCIKIAGLASDTVKIQNLTNNQTCTLIPLTGYRRLPTGTAATTTDGANTLKVTATPAWDGYQYRCVIRDLGGNTTYSETARLQLGDTPAIQITKQPVSAAAAAGEEVVFSTEAEGTDLAYKWQWRADAALEWADCAAEDGGDTATLTVEATEERDGYQYRCVISDSLENTSETNTVQLTVGEAPAIQITRQPLSATVVSGTKVTFEVQAKGTQLTYEWQWRAADEDEWENGGDDTYLEIDSQYGSVKLIGLGSPTFAFGYHDDGFIRLEPANLETGIALALTEGSNTGSVSGLVPGASYAGRYIWADGDWRRILNIQQGMVTLDANAASSGETSTMIATLNRIQITGISKFDKLEVTCKPKIL